MASTKKIPAPASSVTETPHFAEPVRGPIARFLQLVDAPRPPRRGDRAVGGTIPLRAMQYCIPVCTASMFGWYVFLPRSFRLRWDGYAVFYQLDDDDPWQQLKAINYPGFDEVFDAVAPEAARGYAPAFLTAGTQPGQVQIWPGSMVSTASGWSVLVRPVPNLARPSGYDMLEGVVNTDSWLGPLFTNVRLTRTDMPVEFDHEIPFMQVQPVHRSLLDDRFLSNIAVEGGVGSLDASDWARYMRTVVEPNASPDRKRARYAVLTRKGKTVMD